MFLAYLRRFLFISKNKGAHDSKKFSKVKFGFQTFIMTDIITEKTLIFREYIYIFGCYAQRSLFLDLFWWLVVQISVFTVHIMEYKIEIFITKLEIREL